MLFSVGGRLRRLRGRRATLMEGTPGAPKIARLELRRARHLAPASSHSAFASPGSSSGWRRSGPASPDEAILETRDPTIPLVLAEDATAIIGLLRGAPSAVGAHAAHRARRLRRAGEHRHRPPPGGRGAGHRADHARAAHRRERVAGRSGARAGDDGSDERRGAGHPAPHDAPGAGGGDPGHEGRLPSGARRAGDRGGHQPRRGAHPRRATADAEDLHRGRRARRRSGAGVAPEVGARRGDSAARCAGAPAKDPP